MLLTEFGLRIEADFSPLGILIDQLRSELKSLPLVEIDWINRNKNEVAQHLAHHAKNSNAEVRWQNDPIPQVLLYHCYKQIVLLFSSNESIFLYGKKRCIFLLMSTICSWILLT